MGDYRLELADAHEFIKTLRDKSVDLVCCDPPFNTTALGYEQPLNWPALWEELYRCCKLSAQMVFFSAQPFTTRLINSNPKDFRLERIWVKSRKTGHLNSSWRPLQQHENILVFCRMPMVATYQPQMGTKPVERPNMRRAETKRSSHVNAYVPIDWVDDGTRHPTTVMMYESVQRENGGGTHPSQKPLELLKELVLTYSHENDTVLDFCVGSGTTGHACLLTGRQFIGCELDAGYYNTAKKRLESVAAQQSLFTLT